MRALIINTRAAALKAGYIIDSTCYPNVAYKGPRFQPDHWIRIPTEREEELENALTEAGRFFIWQTHGPYGPSPLENPELGALLDKTLRTGSKGKEKV